MSKQEEIQLPETLLADIRNIIEHGRKQAYTAVEQTAIATFWNVGRRIVEEEQNGRERAKYGERIIKTLAEKLAPVYGSSYSKRNLDYYKRFYLLFPDAGIVNTRVHNLEWSHIRRVLSVSNEQARLWYLENASKHMERTRARPKHIHAVFRTTLGRSTSSQDRGLATAH